MLKPIAACLGLLLFGAVALNAQTPPVQPSPVKRTILQRADLPGTNLELIYAALEIVPGFRAGRHSHPGEVIAHVVDGEFWIQFDGQPDRIMRAGETLIIPGGTVHNEGATDKPAKLNVVYALEKGKPLASPAP